MPVPLDYQTPVARASLLSAFRTWYDARPGVQLLSLSLVGGIASILPPILWMGEERAWPLIGYSIALLAMCLIVAFEGRFQKNLLTTRARIAVALIAAFFLSGFIRLQSCPHATYLRLGPVLIAAKGKACNNPQPSRFWTWDVIRAVAR